MCDTVDQSIDLSRPRKVPSYTFSKNTISLDVPVVLNDTEFCVGVYSNATSNATDDGFRLETENGPGLQSYALAPNCDASSFFSLADLGLEFEFCIETFVRGPSLST